MESATSAAIAHLLSLDWNIGQGDPRSEAADDFGHLIHRMPAAVLRARSAREIAELLTTASAQRIPVAARGMGHSTDGQAQVPDGVVVDMADMAAIGPVDGDRITVGAGATWRSVVVAAAQHGMTPPVLTDYLGLSVGGTLSVGGIGGMSYEHGMQTDTVVELEAVTGDGVVHTCSPSREPDLFAALLGGLGQCGIITRATIRLIPAPSRVWRWQLDYPDLTSLLREQRTLLRGRRFEYLEGEILPDGDGWRYMLDIASFRESGSDLPSGLHDYRPKMVFENMTYPAFAQRLDAGEAFLRSTGDWFRPHPWWNAFLPDAGADAFLNRLMSGMTLDDIGTSGLVLVYPVFTDVLRTPLVRVPDSDVMFLVGILRTSQDTAAGEAMVPDNVALFQQARAVGGVAYPISTIPFTRADWERHFGPEWPVLTAAMRRYDPGGILCPGQRIR